MSSAPRLPGHPLVMAEMEGWVAGTSSLDSSLALFSWRSHQAIFWLQSGFYYNYSKARNWGSCANMNLSMCKALPILGLQKGRQTLNHDDITKALPTGGWWASVSSPLPALQTCGSSYFPLSLSLSFLLLSQCRSGSPESGSVSGTEPSSVLAYLSPLLSSLLFIPQKASNLE